MSKHAQETQENAWAWAEEPKTMARVEGTIQVRYPGTRFNVWIMKGLRCVVLKFGKGHLEASAPTWLEALADIDRQRASYSSSNTRKKV